MIIKSTIASFTVTLTSAMQTVHGHEVLVFIALYGLHLMASSYFLRSTPRQASLRSVPLDHVKQVRLQQWAASQDTTFTSF
jgi:hypothetical protein